ncbi:aminotransferase family protein-like protein [Bisporella sp. PMI_857]|nr:aminotransferase family protein-like protein [Bisporella sp. PMI_857]
MEKKVPFGHPMRDAHFEFSPSYTPLNHGSFGAYPRLVRSAQNEFSDLAQERPDSFIVYDLPNFIDSSRAAIAPLLGAPIDDIVFVPNATTGINTVLRNLKYEENDVVVHFSTIYSACEKTLASIAEITPLKCHEIVLNYPVEDEDILNLFHDGVAKLRKEGKNVRLAMFDTVLTFPGARMPWEGLVQACKDLSILSLIDGAHGVGHIDLTHLGDVSPDFFVSNCYKWLYVPRGCAVFYVPLRNQHLIRTSIPTSHGYELLDRSVFPKGKSPFVHLFEFVATIDYTPYLCIPAALNFRDKVCGGEEAIRTYCSDLAERGGKIVSEILGTGTMDNRTKTITKCCFTNVQLPLKFSSKMATAKSMPSDQGCFAEEDAIKIQKWLTITAVKDFDTYLQFFFYNGAMWVRLSGQIYLELGDFEWVSLKLLELCNRARIGEAT